jgi:hypothetical protein
MEKECAFFSASGVSKDASAQSVCDASVPIASSKENVGYLYVLQDPAY